MTLSCTSLLEHDLLIYHLNHSCCYYYRSYYFYILTNFYHKYYHWCYATCVPFFVPNANSYTGTQLEICRGIKHILEGPNGAQFWPLSLISGYLLLTEPLHAE